MQTIIQPYLLIAFLLLLLQTYLLLYAALLLLRFLRILKQPYNGMDYAELLPGAAILLGLLLLSVSSAASTFQAAQTWAGSGELLSGPLLLFFARSFVLVFLFGLLYVMLNFLHIRFLVRGHLQAPALPGAILLSTIAICFAILFWHTCREAIDQITPKLITLE